MYFSNLVPILYSGALRNFSSSISLNTFGILNFFLGALIDIEGLLII